MNNLTKALLGGAALCAFATVPAVAENAAGFHFTTLHGGRVVNKTKLHNHGATHLTYTFSVYAYVLASTPVRTKVTLSSQKVCESAIKVSKPFKTRYAKVSMDVENYSTGCANVSTIFKVLKPLPQNSSEIFSTWVSSRFEQSGTKYKRTLNLDYSVFFE